MNTFARSIASMVLTLMVGSALGCSNGASAAGSGDLTASQKGKAAAQFAAQLNGAALICGPSDPSETPAEEGFYPITVRATSDSKNTKVSIDTSDPTVGF